MDWAALEASGELRELIAKRRRHRWTLNAAWISGFVLYLILMTTGQDLLGTSVLGAVNLSFLMVAFVQILAFALVAVYARKSNREFEAMERRARLRFQQAATAEVHEENAP